MDTAMDQPKSELPPPPTFSFVVPVYNEQDGLRNFHERLSAVANSLGDTYEIVFVNDGSMDASGDIIARLAAADPTVKCVSFARNFGHQVAVTAGYDHASGRAVISLDGDCQHPPELIPQMVARWREGFEVVRTVRSDTEGISSLRRWLGRLTYRVIRFASGADLTDQADFRLLDRKVVDVLNQHREHARFVRGLVHWVGFRQTTMPYTAERRAAGRSSYTLKQLAAMSTAGVFNFSLKPLRLAYLAGGLLLGLAFVYALVALVLWPLGLAPSPWASVAVAFAALFGMQFVMLGILGEYVGRTFEEAKGRPLYIVREKLGFEPPKAAPPAPTEDGESVEEEEREADDFIVYT